MKCKIDYFFSFALSGSPSNTKFPSVFPTYSDQCKYGFFQFQGYEFLVRLLVIYKNTLERKLLGWQFWNSTVATCTKGKYV